MRGWKRIAMPGLLFWMLAVYFLGTAGQSAWRLYNEKNQPCQLEAAGKVITEADVAVILQQEAVLSCTAVYQVETTLSAAGYTMDLTLLGMDSGFLDLSIKAGTLYPDSTGMPYLVVNETALKAFKDQNGKVIEDIGTVDWLNTSVALTVGETAVVGKICGIMPTREEDEAPAVYISRESAKSLIQQTGEIPDANTAWLRIQNAGAEEPVTKALSQLGYSVVNGNEEQYREWALTQATINGQLLASAVASLAALMLLRCQIRLDAALCQAEYQRLQSIGICKGNVRKRMNRVRIAMLLLWGIAGGWGLVWICSILTGSYNTMT